MTVGGDRGLTLHQSPKVNSSKTSSFTGTSNKTITTFTFSETVTNLSFTIIDIDSDTNDFHDAPALSSASTYTATEASSTYMNGTGSVANPWRASSATSPVADASTTGNVTVTFPSVNSFDLHYWNLATAYASNYDGDQRIFVGDMKITDDAC